MTALLEERDRWYETTEETDVTVMEMVKTEETIMEKMHVTDVLTIPLVTSNDLQGLYPSARM